MNTLRLLQFTDTHLFADPRGHIRGVASLPGLSACIGHAQRYNLPADVVAVTGDLVSDDPAAYERLGERVRRLDAPVLLIPGNHDLPDELRAQLGSAPFQVGGSRRIAGWTLVMLETWFAASFDGEGRLGQEQLESLRRTLRANEDQHVLVCLHHPPIAMDSAALDALGLQDAEAFMRIIDAHSNVRGIAWGHAHQALDVYRGAVRLMCTPATSMQFKPREPNFVKDDRPPGYRVIDLQEDGGIATEVVWLEEPAE